VPLQGRLAHFGAPGGARRGVRRGARPARPPRTAAGVWHKHLDGGFPVQGVRFGGIKSVPFGLPLLLARFFVCFLQFPVAPRFEAGIPVAYITLDTGPQPQDQSPALALGGVAPKTQSSWPVPLMPRP
jgi:hypothetical protein